MGSWFWGWLAALLLVSAAHAAEPARADHIAILRDFRFHTGEVMPELRVHYITLGAPTGAPVLVLHGTGGTAEGMLGPAFGGQLFGPGQPLDAATHYIIVPDAIGAGASSKPSDGMRMRFPRYDYGDMISAQYRLLTEALGVKHLQLVIGNSMGGMETWLWGEAYPGFMDALAPLASQPSPVAGRNWVFRRMVIDLIKADPAWNGGDYRTQPTALTLAMTYFGLITSGGNAGLWNAAPTNAAADKLVADSLARGSAGDANDLIYQFDAARDFDPGPGLERITAKLLAINSADDERNPPELGVLQSAIKRVKRGRYVIIPASPQTRGHGTTGNAKLWAYLLPEFLNPEAPPQGGEAVTPGSGLRPAGGQAP